MLVARKSKEEFALRLRGKARHLWCIAKAILCKVGHAAAAVLKHELV